MNHICMLASLATIVVLAIAEDPKSCVFNKINEVQVLVESESQDNPGLTFLFQELALRIHKACENDAKVPNCTLNKLAEEQKNLKTSIYFYETAKNKIELCYDIANEVECTDAVYEALKPIMKQLKLGKDVEEEIQMFQSICKDEKEKSHPKDNVAKFSYANCNFKAFDNNVVVMRKAKPYIMQQLIPKILHERSIDTRIYWCLGILQPSQAVDAARYFGRNGEMKRTCKVFENWGNFYSVKDRALKFEISFDVASP